MLVGKYALERLPSIYRGDFKRVNATITMLIKISDVMKAERLFKSLKSKRLSSYRAMMHGSTDNQMPERALDLFEKISFTLDDVSYSIIFSAHAALDNVWIIQLGNRILRRMPIKYRDNCVFIGSALNMLMKFGPFKAAEVLFSHVKHPIANLYWGKELTRNEQIHHPSIDAAAHNGLLPICQKVADQLSLECRHQIRIQGALISRWVCRSCFPSFGWFLCGHVFRAGLPWLMKPERGSTRYRNRRF